MSTTIPSGSKHLQFTGTFCGLGAAAKRTGILVRSSENTPQVVSVLFTMHDNMEWQACASSHMGIGVAGEGQAPHRHPEEMLDLPFLLQRTHALVPWPTQMSRTHVQGWLWVPSIDPALDAGL